jgi:hypothetical protein
MNKFMEERFTDSFLTLVRQDLKPTLKHQSHDQQSHGNWAGTNQITSEQKKAVQAYTQKIGDVTQWRTVAQNIRDGKPSDAAPEFVSSVKTLLNAIDEHSVTPTNAGGKVLLRSGVNWKGKLPVVGEIMSNPVASATWRHNVAEKFASSGDGKPVIIKYGSNTKGLDTSKFGAYLFGDEGEFIVSGKFEVVGRDKENGFNYVSVRQVADVAKHQEHDQSSHGSWAKQKPNSNYDVSDYIEQTLPWAIAEAEKRGYGPAYTMGQIPKDETVPQGLRNLHEEFNQKNSSIESAKALEIYTSDKYKEVNNALRDEKLNPQSSEVTDIDITVDDLDRTIGNSNGTSATVEVFRGIRGGKFLGEIKVGQGFTDKAYTSTTLDPRMALTSFSSPRSGKILRITVPKGTKGIYVPDWFGATDERAQTKKEQEFILPRGSSFRVTNIQGNVISVEMV